MENEFSKIIEQIKAYLEGKYGEIFVVDRLVSDDGNLVRPNKAYVYPEGREFEWFAVRLDADDADAGGEYEFSDGYGSVMAERVLLPKYQEWISGVIPGGRITIYIETDMEVTDGDYSRDFSIEEFMKTESSFAINMTVLARSELLADKTAFFEKMSHSINKDLDRDMCYKICIAFAKASLDSIDIGKYRAASPYVLKSESDNIIAYTKAFVVERKSQQDINNELSEEFSDDMHLDLSGMEDEDGEDNE